MTHPIGDTQNGVAVYVDLVQSKAAGHIAQQPYLLQLAAEALQAVVLQEDEVSLEHDMQRNIGYDFVVDTSENDVVFYAQLLREDAYMRFVKNGKPSAARHLTLKLRRDDDGAYELLDTWIGRNVPPLPGSSNETSQSRPYWTSHALIRDNQPIQSRTLTKTCPY